MEGQSVCCFDISGRGIHNQNQDEAFSIWNEWSTFYRPDSAERNILEGVRNNRWLVSVVHHDYQNSEALWMFLFDDQESTN
jgi:methylenetetrahydrofolate reductase (NADPH)